MCELGRPQAPVHTLCVGHAESMAAILLASGEKGHRQALPNARIMIHQVLQFPLTCSLLCPSVVGGLTLTVEYPLYKGHVMSPGKTKTA